MEINIHCIIHALLKADRKGEKKHYFVKSVLQFERILVINCIFVYLKHVLLCSFTTYCT